MIPQFASIREFLTNSDYLVEVRSGAGNLSAGTITLYLQSGNRAGLNLQSDPIAVNYDVGDAIAVTFNASARQSGEEVFYLTVSGENTGDSQDAVLLAAARMRETDQTTPRSLPVEILFTEDAHLELNRLFASDLDLPTGNDLIQGAIAVINGSPNRYLYDPDATEGAFAATTGYWINTYLPVFTYVGTTEASADIPVYDVTDYLATPPRQTGLDSLPIRYWLYNEQPENGGNAIRAGTRFQFEFSVDGLTGIDSKLAGTVSYRIVGIVRKLTGILYTDVQGANITEDWNPGLEQLLTTQQEILPGYALVFDLWFNATSDRLISRGIVRPGEEKRIDIYELGEVGVKSDLWLVTGDSVIPGGQLLRVVPNKVLPGNALIKGYSVPSYYEQPIVGLLEDTANQVVAISASRGADVTVYQNQSELDPTEAARAIVGTLPGFYQASEFSNTLTLSADGAISLLINLPLSSNQLAVIRSNYPDPRIANLLAHWHNPKIRVYLLQDGTTLYYRTQLIDSESQATQTIVIDNLNDFAQTPAIPTPNDPYFGVFDYGELTLSDGGSGILPAGNYSVAIAWEDISPNSTITSVNHSESLGCMPELTDLFDRDFNYWKSTKLTVEEARALSASDVEDGIVYGIKSGKSYTPFVFDPSVVSSDNGLNIIKPSFLGSTPGAFVPLPTLNRVLNSDGQFFTRHNLRFQGDGVQVGDNAAGDETVITVPAVPVTVNAIDSNLIWHDGSLLLWHDSTLL